MCGQVLPSFWSYDHANDGLQSLLLGLTLLGAALCIAHDGRYLLEHFCSGADQMHAGDRSRRPVCQELRQFARQWSPYAVFIQIPSIVLPLLFEVVRPWLALHVWTFWIVFTEMLISIRLLHEGTIIRPLKRLVDVLDAATPNMIALVVVLAPLTILTSLMHSQLLGLVDEGFSNPAIALTRIVNMLTAPPPQENTEGDMLRSQHNGAQLLFYWSTIIIRLCFGSFIVAILVSAFNKVRVRTCACMPTCTPRQHTRVGQAAAGHVQRPPARHHVSALAPAADGRL